ncbi:GldM family protein [Flavobacterium sp. SUN052]|uniref:GldM family protein n=1 Tax=Flavobacterium sp. SUN052 TaxID=3002441 RepID=UPI00237D6F34|nr:GldM family protein [Flavobacterium sp. SUN052]MEC4003501.1 GldM family protein [Flavobacterium sp. SUN052]
MTKLFLKIIPFLIIVQTFGQEINITSSRSELINGFPNYLTVKSKNLKRLRFETDNGKIETLSGDQIIVSPKAIGNLKVMVFDKDLKIFERIFQVKDLKPVLYFSTLKTEQTIVSESDLLKIDTVSLYFPDLGCSDFSDTSFKCDIIIKNNNETVLFTTNSKRIPDNVREKLLTLKEGDEINFKNIIYTVGNKEFHADNVSLKVK